MILIILSLLIIIFITIFLYDGDILLLINSFFGRNLEKFYHGKVVWVTGASSGIGRQLAIDITRFTPSKLILSARREDRMQDLKEECLKLNPNMEKDDIIVLAFDITVYKSHEEVIRKVFELCERVDVLILNPGRTQRAKWTEISIDVDKSLFELNVFSIVSFTRSFLNKMESRAKDHSTTPSNLLIGVTSSVAGKVGAAFSSSYSGSKFALHGYFESLRSEQSLYSKFVNLSITLLCPGPVHSEILEHAFTEVDGVVLGEKMDKTDTLRMTTERCSHLYLVALANEMSEAWIVKSPILFFLYIQQYLPVVFASIMKVVGHRVVSKLRSDKDKST